MQKDVWDAPETDIDGASVTSPALANRSLLATDIPKDVFADFQANVGSYVAMGFAYMAFIMGFVFVASTALVVGIVPGVILENEIVMVIGGSLGFMVYAAIIMVFTAVGYPLLGGSALRALRTQMDGGDAAGVGSLFNTMNVDFERVIGLYLVSQLVIMCGFLLFYLPGLIAVMVTTLAMSIHVFEPEVGLTDSLTRAFEHVKENPGWHVQGWLLLIPVFLVLEITIIGLVCIFPVVVAWQVVMYRHAFPNGSRAVA